MRREGLVSCLAFCAALFLFCAGASTAPAAEDFPNKPITWIVPYSPGGGFDTYSRAIALYMPKYLPRKVDIVIKNVPGAGGSRGHSLLYRSRPDGYTIGIINFPGALVDQLLRKQEYDVDRFVYLGNVTTDTYVLSVAKDSPYKTLKDLQEAKTPLRFSTSGKGGTGYTAARIATEVLKIPSQIVTGYKGSSECIVAAIRGDVQATIEGTISTQLPYIQGRELRPIVIFSTKRSKYLPDVPTAQELGYTGGLNRLELYRFIAAPPGTPQPIADILAEALRRSLEDKGLIEWAAKSKRDLAWASGKESREAVAEVSKFIQQYEKLLAE